MPKEQELFIEIETPIPELIVTGTGTVLYLAGSCSHAEQRIRRLEILVDGQAYSDASWQSSSARDADGQNSPVSFRTIVQIPGVTGATSAALSIRATLLDGRLIQQPIAALNLAPTDPEALPSPVPPAQGAPLVVICMTTYNPPLALFRRQICSIRQQTFQNWVCVISDDASDPESLAEIRRVISEDARFLLSPAPTRLGVFRNFERSLSLAPAQAQYLALADQDDYWYPEKLQTLLAQFDANTALVYSDMRIVNERGRVISETFWKMRDNNYQDLASLLLANTITGAASMFVGKLRDQLLPFPPQVGNLFHDHWIACVARAIGNVKYVDRPLYDYVQHGGNVIGYYDSPHKPPQKLHKYLYWTFLEIVRTRQGRERASGIFFDDVLPLIMMARLILERGRAELRRGSKRILRHVARLDRPLSSLVWLYLHGLKNQRPRCPTRGAEYHLLQGVFWKLYVNFRFRE
jgi:glycosyltransferase involved in cell wall biosynthesis